MFELGAGFALVKVRVMVEDPEFVACDDLYPRTETVGIVMGIRMEHAVVDQNPRGRVQYLGGHGFASRILSIAAVGIMALIERPGISLALRTQTPCTIPKNLTSSRPEPRHSPTGHPAMPKHDAHCPCHRRILPASSTHECPFHFVLR